MLVKVVAMMEFVSMPVVLPTNALRQQKYVLQVMDMNAVELIEVVVSIQYLVALLNNVLSSILLVLLHVHVGMNMVAMLVSILPSNSYNEVKHDQRCVNNSLPCWIKQMPRQA